MCFKEGDTEINVSEIFDDGSFFVVLENAHTRLVMKLTNINAGELVDWILKQKQKLVDSKKLKGK